MYRDAARVFSHGERLFRFFSRCECAGETKREKTRQNGEGKSALSMHSHPFDHSSSISDLDLECNSRQEVRGAKLNGWKEKRIKYWDSKLKIWVWRKVIRID